jgi:ABC-type branched-subunit amino acid transport system ATPase component
MTDYRVAFCGASGTGKSTLAKIVSDVLKIPMCNVGSREVAKQMGFNSPYDVDQAGKRAEFQTRLVTAKIAWESEHRSFVTDRTHYDNMAYTLIHSHATVDQAYIDLIETGNSVYTHIFYCPMQSFQNTGDDAARLHDRSYHLLHELVLEALVNRRWGAKNAAAASAFGTSAPVLRVVRESRLDARTDEVLHMFGLSTY